MKSQWLKNMASNKFLDANVLLEILFKRDSYHATKHMLEKGRVFHFSSLSGHLVFHFSKKVATRADIKTFLNDFTMQALTPEDFEWAYEFGKDYGFEDALQVAIAVRSGCTEFITFDQKLIKLINKQAFIHARTPK